MEGCGLRSKLDNDDERRTLEGLLDAFGAVFSLKEIASAYCKACRGSCGYDLQKSRDRYPTLGSLSCASGNKNLNWKTNGTKFPREQKRHDDLQHELLSTLFHFPNRSEEISREMVAINAVKRSKAFRQVVVEPLRDTTVERKTANMSPRNDIEEDDEGDNYLVLRKAVKEYRATMKEYYKAAIEAFAQGDHARASKLLEEGQFFHGKAREADEESAQMITEARNGETEDAVSLDLQNQDAKEAIRLLKCHLSSLSGISSMKYLKVIVETNGEDVSKRSRNKRLIIKLLEKESITWVEDGNPGTIKIRLDEINPKCLSFAKK
ncbi:putative nuclear RNA export factor SDE5 [Camellia lanceoleosa]|uniref:Nuclear RNA export factor SDE5 n=1 Tax=Camellia lanceoleosa TaxID=1840588 RepID=A0ACC0GH78_9ERIC|nr:putative nuclear RNA export factor SDE5 [Camellia lanceoleosa]